MRSKGITRLAEQVRKTVEWIADDSENSEVSTSTAYSLVVELLSLRYEWTSERALTIRELLELEFGRDRFMHVLRASLIVELLGCATLRQAEAAQLHYEVAMLVSELPRPYTVQGVDWVAHAEQALLLARTCRAYELEHRAKELLQVHGVYSGLI